MLFTLPSSSAVLCTVLSFCLTPIVVFVGIWCLSYLLIASSVVSMKTLGKVASLYTRQLAANMCLSTQVPHFNLILFLDSALVSSL